LDILLFQFTGNLLEIIAKIRIFPHLFFSNFDYYILSSLPSNY